MVLFRKKSRRGADAGLVRLEAWSRNPIDAWPGCPLCEREFPERVEGAAHCHGCRLYFAEWGRRPDISERAEDFGRLHGTSTQATYPVEMYLVGRARVWLSKPSPAGQMPLVLPYQSIEDAAYGPGPALE